MDPVLQSPFVVRTIELRLYNNGRVSATIRNFNEIGFKNSTERNGMTVRDALKFIGDHTK